MLEVMAVYEKLVQIIRKHLSSKEEAMDEKETNISYVCLSDLHLGEEHGLLTGVDRDGEVKPLAGPGAVEAAAEVGVVR